MVELGILEPAFATGLICRDEFFVGLGQVNDAFNQANESTRAASHDGDHDLDDSLFGVAEEELMDSQTSQENSQDASNDFLAFG